jgi:hypothetical protein
LLNPSQVFNKFQSLSSLSLSAIASYKSLHARLGHVGDKVLRQTLKATLGPSLVGSIPHMLCEACECGKANRRNIPRKGKGNHDLLEVIESDSQGPFPVVAHDGTTSNIKSIDVKSGYLKMETLPDRKAATALAAFQRFKSRLERRTGKLINVLRTDQGTEFDGNFRKYLIDCGIVRQKGFNYYHTHPVKLKELIKPFCNMVAPC